MASSTKSFLALALLAAAELVAGHGAIIAATGDAGGSGSALGVDPSTPRDGTRRNPFQQDSTRFRGASAQTFGETVGAGANQLEAGTQAIMQQSGGQPLPQVTPGGQVKMTLHQVNSDGAGPYSCMINADGTGAAWTNIQVVEQVPGTNSRNRKGATTDFPLTAAIPAGQSCTGTVAGQSNVCLVRCQNSARAGPFGGVVPVQMASGGSAGSTGNAKAGAGAAAGSSKGSNNNSNSNSTEAAAGSEVQARWERLRIARAAIAQQAADATDDDDEEED